MILSILCYFWGKLLEDLGFPGDSVVKNLPASSGDTRDMVSTPGSGRSSRRRNGNTLQYSCLQKPMDRGAWRAAVHRVAKESDTTDHVRAHTRACTHTHTHTFKLYQCQHIGDRISRNAYLLFRSFISTFLTLCFPTKMILNDHFIILLIIISLLF